MLLVYPYLHRGLTANIVLTEFSDVLHSPVPLAGALGPGRGVFSPKRKHWYVERTSMIAHIYPSVLQAVSGWGYAGCLDGCFQGYQGEDLQDLQRFATILSHKEL